MNEGTRAHGGAHSGLRIQPVVVGLVFEPVGL